MEGLSAAIVTFIAGLVIGVAGAWLLLPNLRRSGQIEKERDEAMAALQRYRDDVDHHFLKTAELVNEMSRAYRDVHQQLSDGARQLCSEQGRRLAASQYRELPEETAGGPVSAPLDYSPSHGTLSEDFGLRRDPQPFTPIHPQTDEDDDDSGLAQPPRDYAEGCDDAGCPPDDDMGSNVAKLDRQA